MTLTEWIEDNSRTLILLGAGYLLAVELGYLNAPNVPDWWPIAGLLLVATAGVGYVVGGKIADLLPDPLGTIIVAQKSYAGDGGQIWELNDPAVEEMEVVQGELFRWEGTATDVFEVREYRPEQNVAVGNWKATKAPSELSSPVEREEIMRQIETLRTDHEQSARYGEAIRNAIPALLRSLDKRRAKNLNAALEGHISPSLGEKSIDDMIREQVPDEALPNYLTNDGDQEGSDEPEEIGAAIEILDDSEPLDPIDPDGPMLNDGGLPDE